MPQGSELEQIGVNAVSSGAKIALTEAVTHSSVFTRGIHWLFNREISLTNSKEVATFTRLYSELKSFCAPSEHQKLPRTIVDCWERFKFENVHNAVYKFSQPLDLQGMLEAFEGKRLIQNHVYPFHPFTSAVLSELATVTSIRQNVTQGIGKIFLSYVFSVALEVSGLETDVEQYAAVTHLQKVIGLFRDNQEYRGFLDHDAFKGLNTVYGYTARFSQELGSTLYLKFIPLALEKFANEQKQVLITVFKTLLFLTEGGNKQKITSDYARISRGVLSDEDESITFHPENPFRDFLMEVALRITDLFGSRIQALKEIRLPSEEEIKVFLESSLEKGLRIGERRGLPRSNDPILYLLEQKITADGKVRWATAQDTTIIQGATSHLSKLAKWLRLHVYAANVAVDLNVLLSIEGQRWLAQGKEAAYIQSFMTGYKTLLDDFQRDTTALHEYLAANLRRSGFAEEHDILRLTNDILSSSVASLMSKGIEPLQNIEERFLKVMDAVGLIRSKYFGSSAILNKEYGFNLPIFDLEATTAREAASAQADNVLTEVGKQEVDMMWIEKIKSALEAYAKGHGYEFELNGHIPKVPKKDEEMHRDRATFIQHALMIINTPRSQDSEILRKLQAHITTWKQRPKYKEFYTSLVPFNKTDIETLIETMSADIERGHSLLAAQQQTRIANPLATPAAPTEKEVYSPREGAHEAAARQPGSAGLIPAAKKAEVVSAEMILLKNLIERFGKEAVVTRERNGFLDFFRTLCLLRKPFFERERPIHRIRDFHVGNLDPVRMIAGEEIFWGTVKTALEGGNQKLIEWGANEVRLLLLNAAARKISPAEALVTVANRQTELSSRKVKLGEEVNRLYMKLKIEEDRTKAWPSSVRISLGRSLTVYSVAASEQTLFLSFVSDRIFQAVRSRNPADDKFIDEFLNDALTQHGAAKQEEMSQYWETVIRGLLVLGANPLSWIMSPNAEGSREKVLMVQQADLILSHITHRAGALREAAAHLNAKSRMESVRTNLRQFADALYECEESVLRRLFGQGKGAITERAEIFWSLVGYIHYALNGELVQVGEGKKDKPSEGLRLFQERYQKAKAAFDGLKDKDRWAKGCLGALAALDKSVSDFQVSVFGMGQSRLLYRNAFETQGLTEERDAANSRAEEANSRAEEAKSRADAANSRADAANSRAEEANSRAEEANSRAEEARREKEDALRKLLLKGLKKLIKPGLSTEEACSGIEEVIEDACEIYARLTREKIVETAREVAQADASLASLLPYISSAQSSEGQPASAVPVSGVRQAFFGVAANATQGANVAPRSGLHGRP